LAGLLGAIVAVPSAAIVATIIHEFVITPHQAATSVPELRKTA
jgi:predicted PurR-regulated permease PerM